MSIDQGDVTKIIPNSDELLEKPRPNEEELARIRAARERKEEMVRRYHQGLRYGIKQDGLRIAEIRRRQLEECRTLSPEDLRVLAEDELRRMEMFMASEKMPETPLGTAMQNLSYMRELTEEPAIAVVLERIGRGVNIMKKVGRKLVRTGFYVNMQGVHHKSIKDRVLVSGDISRWHKSEVYKDQDKLSALRSIGHADIINSFRNAFALSPSGRQHHS